MMKNLKKKQKKKSLLNFKDSERKRVGSTIDSFKQGKLKSGSGKTVTNKKQAIAIAMNQTRLRRSK